ncbi:hypothetical protein C8A00DRAFT_43726 [Chaetomidium leptoderma]|uniref:Anaphase-promoting complex subunit 11 RING-H2 finger domain-containing protein n=1 Tax=Chaetomidium leptoderma TaxID=669021 RepID=A0AAN6ZWE6_9PEZI|nr:hypothetical protein C8A00DRAFT_43726 [Chaetomidium leptoderma]
MKVNIKKWNAVATWRWDIPDDDVCGICQVHFDGTCPTCKYPGDDCPILPGKCGHNFHMLTHPTFSPVFTLLSSTSHSSNRQTTHHPTVHYIFADDDPEILTAALAHHQGVAYDDSGDEGGQSDSPDRGVLLDMEPTADGSGLEVAWASSLTPDWAATSAHLSRMEGGNGAAAAELGANLVLKIEGVSIEPSSGPLGKAPTPETEMQSSGGSAGLPQEEYADLLHDFEKRMSTLRKVVEAGAARQRALGDGGGQFSQGTVKERAAAPFRPETGGDGAEGRGGGGQ